MTDQIGSSNTNGPLLIPSLDGAEYHFQQVRTQAFSYGYSLNSLMSATLEPPAGGGPPIESGGVSMPRIGGPRGGFRTGRRDLAESSIDPV